MNFNIISISDIDRLVKAGIEYYDKRQYVDALRVFTRILKADENHFESHFYLSAIYEIVGEYDKAIQEFEKLIKIKEDDYDLKEFLLNLYIKRKRYRKAISIFKKLFKKEPYSFRYWEMFIDILIKSNKFHSFLNNTKIPKEYKTMTNDVILRTMLMYRDSDQISNALMLSDYLLTIDGKNPINHYFVGTIYEAINDTNRLKEEFKQTLILLKTKDIDSNILYQEIYKRLTEIGISY